MEFFIPFYSATYTRDYLHSSYSNKNILNAKTKSYQASYPFIYYLKHGDLYFTQATHTPIALKPILLFYGLIQYIKGCILTSDPNYPENSDVLAHGVSTRKRKKATYQFLKDEVKIQKNGLFRHFLDKMFHMKHFEHDKYNMKQLLLHVADMHPLFSMINGDVISYKGEKRGKTFVFPSELLDQYHMTPNRFQQYIESFPQPIHDKTKQIIEKEESLYIPVIKQRSFSGPWRFNSGNIPFILKEKEMTDACPLPDLAIHYLLLYNLSMICRYEIEWWGELTHTYDGIDYPFISHYLHVAERIIPELIAYFLNENIKKGREKR